MLSIIDHFLARGEQLQGASIEFRRFPCQGWPKRYRATLDSAKGVEWRRVGFGDTMHEAVRDCMGMSL